MVNYSVQVTSGDQTNAQNLRLSLEMQSVETQVEPCVFDISSPDIGYTDQVAYPFIIEHSHANV